MAALPCWWRMPGRRVILTRHQALRRCNPIAASGCWSLMMLPRSFSLEHWRITRSATPVFSKTGQSYSLARGKVAGHARRSRSRLVSTHRVPKTGSTTLQKGLFSRCREIAYLTEGTTHSEWRLSLLRDRELAFAQQCDAHTAALEQSLVRVKRRRPAYRTIVHSDESLTSHAMFFQTSEPPLVRLSDPAVMARKLHRLFTRLAPAPKVVVCVRRQGTMLEALYAQVRQLVFRRFRQTATFEAFCDYAFAHPYDFILDALNYASVVNVSSNLFGRQNVHVRVFEELQSNC